MYSLQLQEEKVFKDPVHKYIHVQDQTIWDLINAKEFQRLRRIRQLGTSYLTFHGAEHSRFSHSLGVYEITRRIISQFERSGYSDWPQEERLLALCAALLHDLGHGPFSHSIEEAFQMHHEDWTCRIIRENSEIHEVLRRISDDFPERVASVIQKTYDKPIVVHLVSSALDADRMDYLLRDAYFTGVNYGTFDMDRILRVLRPYRGRIVVKESGMHAIEDYLMSRYQMYWQVYFHPVTRSSEIILRQIFKRAQELYDNEYSFQFMLEPLPSLFEGKISMEQYIRLDEALIQTVFMQWTQEQDEILADLCDRFMERKLYKYVTLDHLDDQQKDKIHEQFVHAGLNPAYDLEIDSPTDLSYSIYRSGEHPMGKQIVLLNHHEQLREISEVSEIVRSISGIRKGKFRLYFPENKLRAVAHLLDREISKLFDMPTT
ncbi:HD domain-containing protein [Paenibacillus sp. GCM10027629]|uniref:HD domain-containing protein n=1 Tax=Paenibacillus sp. GCM10027629 TaxID=3273414 RepID=UPI0036321BF6